MKYYVASDVHGFHKELCLALEEKGFFADHEPHKLILLGDLFDRGQDAGKTQDFVLELMERDEVILIRGNHEDLYEDLVTRDNGAGLRHHIKNGTYDTALQLTKFDSEKARICPQNFVESARQTPLYQRIIPAMQDFYETENYIFVHGWIPCNYKGGEYTYCPDWRNASETEWKKARWYNGIDASETAQAEKTVVCGHWNASYGHAFFENKGSEFGRDAIFTPYFGAGVIAIDACTVCSGFVNVLVIEDEPEVENKGLSIDRTTGRAHTVRTAWRCATMNGLNVKYWEGRFPPMAYYQKPSPYACTPECNINLYELAKYAERTGKKIVDMPCNEVHMFAVPGENRC